MELVTFVQIAAASMVGCILAAVLIWALWTIERMQRSGVPESSLPLRLFALAIVPLCVLIFAIYKTTT